MKAMEDTSRGPEGELGGQLQFSTHRAAETHKEKNLRGRNWYLGSEGLRESSVRDADVSLQELDHGLGEGQLVGPFLHLRSAQVVLHHELGQVAHDLRGRRHLGDGSKSA